MDQLTLSIFHQRLLSFPVGTYDVHYRNRRYLMHLRHLLNKRVIKLYAVELGGNDIVSANYYPTLKRGTLKPCEISAQKVVDFVLTLTI